MEKHWRGMDIGVSLSSGAGAGLFDEWRFAGSCLLAGMDRYVGVVWGDYFHHDWAVLDF